MSGNKHGAEAEGLQYTLGRRKSVPELIAADPAMSPHMQTAYKLFDLTGDTNIERVAKAGSEVQTQGIRDKAVANVGDVDQMNRYNVLAKPGETYEPFDAVGNTGHSINQATGASIVSDELLSKLYDRKTGSEIAENNAQAYNANMSGNQHREKTTRLSAGLGKPLTAAQMRENVAIQEARDAIADMTQGDIDAVLSKSSFDITPGDRNLINLHQRANKPMFGEADMVPVTPRVNPPAPPPEPSVISKVFGAVTNRLAGNDTAKSPAPTGASPNMNSSDAIAKAKDAIARGAPRDKVIKRLRENGIDTTGL
jgi:hypothetical protein